MNLKLACVQYRPDFLGGWGMLADKLDTLAGAAVKAGAGLVLFPEFAGMELASLLPPGEAADPVRSMAAIQELLPEYLTLYRDVARRHGCIIAGGSIPVREGGRWRNRMHVFSPRGLAGYQDKLVMTRFEREQWGLTPGDGITLFQAAFGTFAIALCYDVEFPALVAGMAAAGAELLLVPSCTETEAGFNRVRACARARAVEQQMFVAQAPLVGDCPWSPAIDINIGLAGIFSPCDAAFPADGILAQGISQSPQLVLAVLDFGRISRVREDGQVLNFRHQRELAEREAFSVERVVLG